MRQGRELSKEVEVVATAWWTGGAVLGVVAVRRARAVAAPLEAAAESQGVAAMAAATGMMEMATAATAAGATTDELPTTRARTVKSVEATATEPKAGSKAATQGAQKATAHAIAMAWTALAAAWEGALRAARAAQVVPRLEEVQKRCCKPTA